MLEAETETYWYKLGNGLPEKHVKLKITVKKLNIYSKLRSYTDFLI